MLKAAQCLTLRPGQSIRVETETGEITLNVITTANDSVRIEVAPLNVEAVSVQPSVPVRSKAITKGNCWVNHLDKAVK